MAQGALRRTLAESGELTVFSATALREVPGSFIYTAEILRQFGILVRKSTFFICALAVFIGFSATTFAFYVLQAFGATDFAGAITGIVTPRMTVPFTYGYAFAAIVGCSLVAEIGAMKINEEIDAYEAEAVNPMRFVVATRVVAAILFAPLVAGIAMVANGFGSYLNMTAVTGSVNPATFWRYHWGLQAIPELVFAVVVMTTMGVAITLVSSFYGYRASGGPAGVGAAVARSIVVNLPMAQLISGLATYAVYGAKLDLGLPVGG